MPMLRVPLEDSVVARLEALSIESRRDPSDIAAEAIRLYVERDRLQYATPSSSVRQLYEELAAEDVKLAEAGIGDYARLAADADGDSPHDAR